VIAAAIICAVPPGPGRHQPAESSALRRLARVSILRPGMARQRPLLLCAGKIAEATENIREAAQPSQLAENLTSGTEK
jgi:hypothetical protein